MGTIVVIVAVGFSAGAYRIEPSAGKAGRAGHTLQEPRGAPGRPAIA